MLNSHRPHIIKKFYIDLKFLKLSSMQLAMDTTNTMQFVTGQMKVTANTHNRRENNAVCTAELRTVTDCHK